MSRGFWPTLSRLLPRSGWRIISPTVILTALCGGILKQSRGDLSVVRSRLFILLAGPARRRGDGRPGAPRRYLLTGVGLVLTQSLLCCGFSATAFDLDRERGILHVQPRPGDLPELPRGIAVRKPYHSSWN